MGEFSVIVASDADFIAAFEVQAKQAEIATQPHELTSHDSELVILEVAAVIATLHAAAKLAKTLVEVWALTKRQSDVTITTPKGTVTVKGDSGMTVEALVEELKPILA